MKVFEDEIARDQLEDLLPDNEPFHLANEYAERKTLEAKIAKDADLLDQALLVQEYILNGNQEAREWAGEHKFKEFQLESSRELYQEIITTKPTAWWRGIWTSKRRE